MTCETSECNDSHIDACPASRVADLTIIRKSQPFLRDKHEY